MSDARVTFEYENLGERWCHFDTEEERQAAIEQFISDLRSYFAEGYEGDGDGWAPRDWEETNRLARMVYAARDLRWKRDADGQGGIDIHLSPRAQGITHSVFVPHNPEDIAEAEWRRGRRKGDPDEISDIDFQDWVAAVLTKGNQLINYGQSTIQLAQFHLDYRSRNAREAAEYEAAWKKMLSDIAKAETPLAAQHIYLALNDHRDVSDEKYREVHFIIMKTFGHQMVEYDALLADIDSFGTSVLDKGASYEGHQHDLPRRIISFQRKYGFIPASIPRNRFNRIGELWRDRKGAETGLPRSQWSRNGVPPVTYIGRNMIDPDTGE